MTLVMLVLRCFQAVSLSSDYKAGKLLAYQLLCTMTLRRHDVALPMDHLLRFYIALHHGLVSEDQVSSDSLLIIIRFV